MKLQVKFAILFSLLALVPLFFVSYLGFVNERKALLTQTLDQLVSLASVQEERVEENIAYLLEQIKLVTSRTQLRASLYQVVQGVESERARIDTIIADAKESSTEIDRISIISTNGVVLSSTDASYVGADVSGEAYVTIGQRSHTLHDVIKDEDNIIKVRLVGPLLVEGEVIGIAEAVVNADPLTRITEDYTGLGKTGEVVLAKSNAGGDAVFLTPLRFDAGAALARAVPRERTEVAVNIAIAGEERVLTDDTSLDYRGKHVIAVTRFIDSVGWGLVAKIDRDEALAAVDSSVKAFVSVVSLTTLLIIGIALLVTQAVTKPIIALTQVASRLKDGAYDARATIRGSGELMVLADAFNSMASRVQESYASLEKRVAERTKELEQAKAKDEAILANIGDGLVVTDKDRNILLINKAGCDITGRTAQEIVGKQWPEALGAAGTPGIVDEGGTGVPAERLPIVAALSQQKTTSCNEYYYVRKDNTRVAVSITASPLIFGEETVGAIVAFRNISQEKEIDKAKTEFVSLASHQLRTPLSTIGWYAEMLLAGDAGKISKAQKEYLEEIYTGNQRMVDLVNALLNVSRLELGTFTVEPEPTNIVELTKSVITEQKPQIDARKQAMKCVFGRDIPTADLDPKLIRMVVQNLVSNAIKYSPEGGAIAVEVLKKGTNISISVTDSGYGIPKDEQSKIFTKLFRASNVKERDTEGTGLGLYIVKSIAEHSGGSVTFTSEEGKGTTFTVLIPLNGMKKKEGSRQLS